MRAAQSHKKSYADRSRRHLEFVVRDRILLKVSPTKELLDSILWVSLAQGILDLILSHNGLERWPIG